MFSPHDWPRNGPGARRCHGAASGHTPRADRHGAVATRCAERLGVAAVPRHRRGEVPGDDGSRGHGMVVMVWDHGCLVRLGPSGLSEFMEVEI